MPSLVSPALGAGSLSASAQPVLSTGSVILRPWTFEDVPALVAAYAEPDIQRWHARSMSREEAGEWVAETASAWSEEKAVSWAVTVDGTLVGRMTLKIQAVDGIAEAAYWTRGEHRSRGISSRALDAAAQWAFSVGVHRVELEHSALNPASCRVAVKAGFIAEGTRREAALHADGWHDMHTHGRIAPKRSEHP